VYAECGITDNPVANLQVPPRIKIRNAVFFAQRINPDTAEQGDQGAKLDPASAKEVHGPAETEVAATLFNSAAEFAPASPAS